jgi:hypothetical protein
MTINNRLTKLEEQTAELIIEAQELRKEISKTEDVSHRLWSISLGGI